MDSRLRLIIPLLFVWGAAHAEQGCPDGLYPGGAQPGPICIRIPGYGLAPIASSPSPEPIWEDRWGAIATDPHLGILGIASNLLDRVSAEQTALSDCMRQGGTVCAIDKSYSNQCAALVQGDKVYIVGTGATIEGASDLAKKALACSSPDSCRVHYASCSYPRQAK